MNKTSLSFSPHGILVLNKPKGMTSQEAVSKVKKGLGVKKAGHTGTLDPLATGVLPIALGEATKIIPHLDESCKEYRVKGKLGAATDSFDAEGKEVHWGDASRVGMQDLEHTLKRFRGSFSQSPPMFSAIKVGGKPLYRYARKGEAVAIPTRKVHVEEMILENFSHPFFTLKVSCSRGTYIRSLVHDLGEALGCFAHVSDLHRLRSGPFLEDWAMGLVEVLGDPVTWKRKLLSIEDCLTGLPSLNLLGLEEAALVLRGGRIQRLGETLGQMGLEGRTVALKCQGRVLALIRGKGAGRYDYLRVLNKNTNDFIDLL